MPKKKEAGKSTDNGKGKGKASASPSSTQAQSARDIGATFLGADDDDAGSDLTVEGLMPALAAMRAEITRRRAQTAAAAAAAAAGDGVEGEADLWALKASPVELLGATTDDVLLAYLRWAIKAPSSPDTGGGRDAFNVTRAARRLEKLAKFGQKHHQILTEPPLDLVELERAYKKWGIVVGTSPAADGRVVIALEFDAMDMETICADKGAPLIRLFWYLIHALGLDPMVQEYGCVFIEDFAKASLNAAYRLPSWKENLSSVVKLCQGASPIKFKQFHLVRQPWWMTVGLTIVRMLLSAKMRKRLQSHSDFTTVLADVGGLDSIPSNMFEIGGKGSAVDRVFKKQVHKVPAPAPASSVRSTASVRSTSSQRIIHFKVV